MSTIRDFKPIAGLAVSDAEIDSFVSRRGIPSLSTTAPEVPAPSPNAQPKSAPISRRVTLDVPEYVVDQLHHRALAGRCTTRHVIMMALKAAGIVINDQDMISDGRRLR